MMNLGDSRRSLERLMLGGGGQPTEEREERESAENLKSNRDFAATLGKEKSQGSKS